MDLHSIKTDVKVKDKMKSFSIYIHIPYCLKKCPYCNFNSYELNKNQGIPEEYIKALIKESEIYGKSYGIYAKYLKSIYFGGGTPSLLKEYQLEKLLSSLYNIYQVKNPGKIEISVEVNPGTANDEKLRRYKSLGINRFIIGVQSFNNRDLKKLGRIHSSLDSLDLLEKIKDIGAKNFGIDLIFGIPGQTSKTWLENLKTATSFNPKHISTYNLTLEEGTPMIDIIAKKGWSLPQEELQLKLFHEGAKFLKRLEYKHYEISNFAQKGFESIHNKNYWSRGLYLGIGAGAHSFIKEKKRRFWNFKDPTIYIGKLSRNELPTTEEEAIDPSKELLEDIFLSLRTSRGLRKNRLAGKISNSKLKSFITDLKKSGLLKPTKHSITLNERGFFLSNEITSRLINLL